MQFIFHDSSNLSGIYKITNKVNNKIYIGSAKRFKDRASSHLNKLKNKKHHNEHLQNAFNIYGSENFLFEVVCIVKGDKQTRIFVEQECLDLLDWNNCYNVRKDAGSPEGCKQIGFTDERRKEISKRFKELWKDPKYKERMSQIHKGRIISDETRKKLSVSNKGKRLSKEQIAKFVNSMQKHYNDISWKQRVSEINKERWKDSSYRKMHSGTNHHMFNKKHSNESKQKISEKLKSVTKLAKQYKILNIKTNEIILIKNLSKFCREYNLNRAEMTKTTKGKIKQHRDYKIISVL